MKACYFSPIPEIFWSLDVLMGKIDRLFKLIALILYLKTGKIYGKYSRL